MFMCKHCLEQFDDAELAYSLIPENRLNHPAVDAFIIRFCSRAHLQEFLGHSRGQHQRYLLSRMVSGKAQEFPAAAPLDLLHQMGSTIA